MAIGFKTQTRTRHITISQWVCNSQTSRAAEIMTLDVTKSNAQIRFQPHQPVPQILIPFYTCIFFERDPVVPREEKIIFRSQELIE
ncbi:hypothetical protein N7454_007773 [Penicillium verhagenii]|nr:hypothetical protein N7454_007773 [Penicillium verhagenii]